MTKFLFALSILISANTSHATYVDSAELDSSKQNLIVKGTLMGGCEDHQFDLKLGACLKSYPMHCFAELVDITPDYCDAIAPYTTVIPLTKYHLNELSGATLTITGEANSKATVQLP